MATDSESITVLYYYHKSDVGRQLHLKCEWPTFEKSVYNAEVLCYKILVEVPYYKMFINQVQ
jgi:hypothetical protein